jgi:hypothetical protein
MFSTMMWSSLLRLSSLIITTATTVVVVGADDNSYPFVGTYSNSTSDSGSSSSSSSGSTGGGQCEFCGWVSAFLAMLAFGTFGAPIKSHVAKSLDIDPLVMQTYKTSMCFITSWIFVILRDEEVTFTPWGVRFVLVCCSLLRVDRI